MDIEKNLISLGLTENESKVYLDLLKLGEVRTGKLSKETEINRSLIYRVLESLQKKGLVSRVTKENRSYFSANNPKNIKKILEEKQQNLDEIMPSLLQMTKKEPESMHVEVYSGLRGIKIVLREQLENVKEFYVLGAGNEFASLTEHFYDQYYNIRIERKITQKILFKREAQDRAKKVAKTPYSKVRVLDSSYKVPMAIIIYGDKTAFVSWTDKKVIVINSKNISSGFVEQFDLLWKLASK